MQQVGLALLSLGIWIVYCGFWGISPIDTAKAIIVDPGSARDIIGKAREASIARYPNLLNAKNNAQTERQRAILEAGQTVSDSLAGFLAKGINPYIAFPVTGTWASHIARKSAGGTDYGMPVGTPVVTPKAGVATVLPNWGTAGNTVKVRFDDGYTIELMHLSSFSVSSGDKVRALQVVGKSGGAKGAAGSGSSTGPHLHVDILNPKGAKIQFEKYLVGTAV